MLINKNKEQFLSKKLAFSLNNTQQIYFNLSYEIMACSFSYLNPTMEDHRFSRSTELFIKQSWLQSVTIQLDHGLRKAVSFLTTSYAASFRQFFVLSGQNFKYKYPPPPVLLPFCCLLQCLGLPHVLLIRVLLLGSTCFANSATKHTNKTIYLLVYEIKNSVL